MDFGHLLTAMVTPFDHEDNLDLSAIETLVNYLIENGTDGLVIGGTTGESPTLTTDEKLKLFQHVVEIVDRRIPVIAGTGSNHTKQSIELTKRATETGVDGIMLVTPYYNKPSQEGLFQHFKSIAEATHLPIMLYDVPGRSSIHLSVETTVKLSHIDNIVSIKDASGDLNAMASIIESTPDHFTLYSGDDPFTLPVLAIGGQGVVSVASHIVGQHMQHMIQHFLKGEITEAAKIHRHLLPVMDALFAQPSPTPVKTALDMQNINVGGVRPPLIPLTSEQSQALAEIIQKQEAHLR